jgi:hypothetical protein
MKSSDRTILMGLAVVGLIAAFWFLLLSPKREQASELETQVSDLQAEVEQSELDATEGEQAKDGFEGNYRRLVSLGKAVPKDAETSSLLVQLEALSNRSDVSFRGIELQSSGTPATAAPPVTTTPPATTTPATTTETTTDATTTAATPAGTTTPGALATEATAALLPIGATVGPAGLPVMPYQLKFQGGFFEIADFFGSVDGMVDTKGKKVNVDGRLLTIDGFSFEAAESGFPNLTATVSATSYLTPADQGVTAGATPEAPATAAPVPATTTTTPAPATAAVTP